MRYLHKASYFLAVVMVNLFVLTVGCTPVAEKSTKVDVEPPLEKKSTRSAPAQAAMLVLMFIPQDSVTYKVIVEAQKSVKWEGPLAKKPNAFKGGRTSTKIEMTFAQTIHNVDDNGNAIAEITIKDLIYLAQVANDVVLDFDSSKEKDPNSPLKKLVGQSYTIEISPAGQVLKVIDTKQAQTVIKGNTRIYEAALQLLDEEVVKQRHTIPALAILKDKNQFRPGEKWSEIETLSFDMMGFKTYEKTYELKEIEDADGYLVAVAEMNAIPSTELAEDANQNRQANIFSRMFDNIEKYTGQLRFDLTAGNVQQCHEKLEVEWVIADPSTKQGEEPSVIRMKADRFYSMERVD
jgi:hypothetical protein